jgi:hypothetical protein
MLRKETREKINQLKKGGQRILDTKVVMKVFQTKHTGQLMVTIPKDSKIKAGDYVEIIKIE